MTGIPYPELVKSLVIFTFYAMAFGSGSRTAQISGSGRVTLFPGRVGSQNLARVRSA